MKTLKIDYYDGQSEIIYGKYAVEIYKKYINE